VISFYYFVRRQVVGLSPMSQIHRSST